MVMGILIENTIDQAIEKAGLPKNKGHEAALCAIQMASLCRKIGARQRERALVAD
jgi:6,7-dimethyl-8-ribityllumazine synthase